MLIYDAESTTNNDKNFYFEFIEQFGVFEDLPDYLTDPGKLLYNVWSQQQNLTNDKEKYIETINDYHNISFTPKWE